MKIIPASRPQIKRDEAEKLIVFTPLSGVVLIGVRGYYLDSMGAAGKNDRGIYDDAMIVLSDKVFETFNFNTDPSVARAGIAVLKPGAWSYKIGIHGYNKPPELRYEALVQAGKVTVARDNQADDTGYFGINIHRGSARTTSSLGCQTIYPAQWGEFVDLVKEEMHNHDQTKIVYNLITEETRRERNETH